MPVFQNHFSLGVPVPKVALCAPAALPLCLPNVARHPKKLFPNSPRCRIERIGIVPARVARPCAARRVTPKQSANTRSLGSSWSVADRCLPARCRRIAVLRRAIRVAIVPDRIFPALKRSERDRTADSSTLPWWTHSPPREHRTSPTIPTENSATPVFAAPTAVHVPLFGRSSSRRRRRLPTSRTNQ